MSPRLALFLERCGTFPVMSFWWLKNIFKACPHVQLCSRHFCPPGPGCCPLCSLWPHREWWLMAQRLISSHRWLKTPDPLKLWCSYHYRSCPFMLTGVTDGSGKPGISSVTLGNDILSLWLSQLIIITWRKAGFKMRGMQSFLVFSPLQPSWWGHSQMGHEPLGGHSFLSYVMTTCSWSTWRHPVIGIALLWLQSLAIFVCVQFHHTSFASTFVRLLRYFLGSLFPNSGSSPPVRRGDLFVTSRPELSWERLNHKNSFIYLFFWIKYRVAEWLSPSFHKGVWSGSVVHV